MRINKNFFIRSLLAISLLFLIMQANCIAQDKTFPSLKRSPIEIQTDSISPKKGQWGDLIINFKSQTNKKTIEVQRIDASSNETGAIITITKAQETVYIIPIYELLVGYDYCIVIRENPFSCFISDKFNMDESKYSFCKNKINLSRMPFYVTIQKNENKKEERVRLKPIKLGN